MIETISKKFKVMLVTVDGTHDFARVLAEGPDEALGLVVHRQTGPWTREPHSWKVFDISQGEAHLDPVLVVPPRR